MPNILLLCADSLRADRCYAPNRPVLTPNIDRMRLQGASLKTVVSVNTFTTPCVSSLLTGAYPFRHGCRTLASGKLSADVSTMAEVLSRHGVHTYADVTGPISRAHGHDRGFERFRFRHPVNENLWSDWWDDFIRQFTNGRLEEPWFYYLHIWDTHSPFAVPWRYRRKRFGRRNYDRAISAFDSKVGAILEANKDNVVMLTADHGESLPTRLLNVLYWQIRTSRLGCRLRNCIPSDLRNSLVRARNVFGGWMDRRVPTRPAEKHDKEGLLQISHGISVYEPGVRIPWIIRGPQVPAGSESEELVSQVDIAPTVLDLATGGRAAAEARQMDGRSILPLLLAGGSSPARAVYCESTHEHVHPRREDWLQSVRDQRYKFITAPWSDTIADELYDLKADPAEKVNIADQKPDIVQRMSKLLWQVNTVDRPSGVVDTGQKVSAEEAAAVEQRLRDLGYME